MVLILGRRLNHENSSCVPESPAIKRKVFEVESKTLSDVYNFTSGSSHSESVLQVFNEFRDSRLFTDVIISVQGREFPCHRAMLSACSSYFRAMFCNDHRESHEMLVEINGIQADAMDTFLQYVYTGRACITTHNVQFLFETSSLFQITTLRDACAKFLEEQLDPCNCLGIQRFADAHSLKQLASRCRAFALLNFPEVAQHEEFLDLHKDELEAYLASDELCIGREEVVFEAVMRWVYHGVEYRRPMLKDLLQHVRLALLHPNYFVQTVEGDKLIQNAPECYQLLHEARRYHILGNEMMSPRARPRRSTGFSEVIVVVGGCERMGSFNLPYTECYDPVTGEWTSLAKHPEYTKSEYAVCALRNDIIVSGGRINSSYVWMYNSQLNIWIRVASLNKGRWRHKMTVLLGKVYAVGGYDGQTCLSNVEVYDSFSNRWTEVAPMKEAVSCPAVTSCAGKLFVIGGEPYENSCSSKVQCYDPESDSWQLKACIPITKPNISAVSLNHLIYVCGGLTKSIYCYDPSQDHWMHVGHTFSRQESCGMSVCNGKIYILGGRGENGEASDNIVCYDPASGIITCTAAMPRPISYHGCVTIHRFSEKQHKP
ncbi:kelch-like protein 24 [Sinocyclocheilus rhinocerous]|uniref:Kelch-like protein 24 n=1 Tax=Sinocyclocheilus rhinocerous TaxID=307959 RepID=A0A673MMW7_9TELE|nr:PREDICTED: kelch-like protein 24 [Sinocyclocheilus rhinocerous]XP_016385440.1 PREDICTED: kelch-like protein 24 [Sinocyclocheilus rhinocerous]